MKTFDGDAMNGIIPPSLAAKTEIRLLGSFNQMTMNYQDSMAMPGSFQDGLIGIFEMTLSNVKIDRFHAMQLFGQLNINPKLPNKKTFTGRELISLVLPNLSLKSKPTFYNESFSRYIKYNPDDVNLNIENGVIRSGVLDKTSVGQKSSKGIFKIIAKEYGSAKALEIIYIVQQLATAFLFVKGYSLGIQDCLISEKAEKDIQLITSKIIAEANIITEKLNNGKIIPPIGSTVEQFYEEQILDALSSNEEFIKPILESIDPYKNGIFKLIACGSKGKPDNLLSISSALKQVEIDGQRIKKQFGYERTLPYYTRFDTSPESRGYVAASFRAGLNSAEFIFSAQNGRVQLIANALKTSVAGEQNRKAIKTLESLHVNNLYNSEKNGNIVQLLFGDNAIDPRHFESVKINTIMCSDKELESNYKASLNKLHSSFRNKKVQSMLDEEFKQIKNDREECRKFLFKRENVSLGNTSVDNITDRFDLPVNVFRIMESVNIKSKEKFLDPIKAINRINDFCIEIKYTLMNEYQESVKGRIPEHMDKSFSLFVIFLRSYLNIATLLKYGFKNDQLEYILNKIKVIYQKSLVDYGKAVGIISAQSISEFFTQDVLDSKHKAGLSGSKKTKGMKRIKEITGAKPTEKMQAPTMVIQVAKGYEHDESKVREIANHIEMLKFGRFISKSQLYFEEYGKPIYPGLEHESKIYTDFEKYNIGIKIPSNITKWVLRYELSKIEMIIKSIKLETIIHSLQKEFKDVFIVYTPENADKIVIKVHILNTLTKRIKNFDQYYLREFNQKMLDHTVRGVKGILSCDVITKARSYVADDGSIQKKKDQFMIQTTGTNIKEIMKNPWINKTNIQTDSIKEVAAIYGIEAARQKIINEIKDLISGKAYCHYTMFADEMVYTSVITSMERSGLSIREPESALLRMATGAPVDVIQDAAANNINNKIHGVSGPMIIGKAPEIGSLYNTVIVNEEFVSKNTTTVESVIDML